MQEAAKMVPLAKSVLSLFTIFVVLSCQHQVRSTAQSNLPQYLLTLYANITRYGTKLPFGASTIRGIFFTNLQKINNAVELTVDLRSLGTNPKLTRDEIHLFLQKNTKTQDIQHYTLLIKESLTSKLITSRNITSQTSGWERIELHLWLQKWLNNNVKNNGLRISFNLSSPTSSSNQSPPTIDITVNKPYLIIYLGPSLGPKKQGK